jgi:exodeoxyribonuclease X
MHCNRFSALFPDAYVTAHRMRDMLNAVSARQLVAWSREPGLPPRVPAGPDRGKAWRDASGDVVQALARGRDPDVRFSGQTELRPRGELPDVSPAQLTLP